MMMTEGGSELDGEGKQRGRGRKSLIPFLIETIGEITSSPRVLLETREGLNESLDGF